MKNSRYRKENGFNSEQSSSEKKQAIEKFWNIWPEHIMIHHEWYSRGDNRQQMVQRAFEVGGLDLVILIECENGRRDPFAVWDSWHAFWLCQVNDRYHKIPQKFWEDWWYQIELCNEKMNWWTKFYWPKRIINGQNCKDYVMDRFTFVG